MPLDLERFALVRPYLFHLTATINIPRLRRMRVMESANRLLRAARRTDILRKRRADSIVLRVDDDEIHVRDQAPLHRGNMALAAGMTFEDFIDRINSHVFFWPGTAAGPNAYGMRHFERYREERPALIRVPTSSLFSANPSAALRFCRFNSGSPRWTQGRPSPRGATTFVRAEDVDFAAGRIVEVTFSETVRLPADAALGTHPTGPWKSIA